jgi:hypothetical protein
MVAARRHFLFRDNSISQLLLRDPSILSFIAKLYDPLRWDRVCHYCRKDFVPRALVAQGRLACPNSARFDTTLFRR